MYQLQLKCFTRIILVNPCLKKKNNSEVGTTITLILHLKKLQLREVKLLSQNHTANRWDAEIHSRGCLTSKQALLTTFPSSQTPGAPEIMPFDPSPYS